MRSGLSAAMASICASSSPPRCGSFATSAGQFEYRSTPTSRDPAPSTQAVSVSDGSMVTMRCGGALRRCSVPRSSRIWIGCAATHDGPSVT